MIVDSRRIHSLSRRNQRNLLPKRASQSVCRAAGKAPFFWWHPKSPTTEEIHDEKLYEEEISSESTEIADYVAATSSPTPPLASNPPEETTDSAAALSNSVRHLMRHLPAPIVVLTTSNADQYHGMTLSSFTTLSLSPEPIISFNIRTNDEDPSWTLTSLEQTRHFLIHVLEGSIEGATIADVFTRGRGVFGGGKEGNAAGFEVEEVREQEVTLPMLKGWGVAAVLRCEVLRDGVSMQLDDPMYRSVNGSQELVETKKANGSGFIRVGDHVLVIARVLEIIGEKSRSRSSKLSYLDGRYRRAGKAL